MEIGRNEPCPCGSGIAYKKCCLNRLNVGYQLHLKGKKAEEFVYQLSKRSFLEDWCYQNPKLPNGKEICDLLVVYDDVAIIWQIKDLKLDDSGNYNEAEVKKNLHQLSTARRRLFEPKIPIYLENPRRGKERFDPKQIKKVYLISALLGEGETYSSFIEFTDGRVIHIFTREFTEIALKELDTIKDFVDYLREKESLVSVDNRILLVGGEKELLACYLANGHRFGELNNFNSLVVAGGCWDDLKRKPEYTAKKEKDRISYGWDSIINRAHTCGGKYEGVARELARPSRFERRVLSESFFEAHLIAHNQRENNVFNRVLLTKGTTYCFVFFDDTEPRDRRNELLGAVCFIARGVFKDNKKVIGIATEMRIRPACSYDFCLLNIPCWTDIEQKEKEKLQSELGIFKNLKPWYVREAEYPPQPQA